MTEKKPWISRVDVVKILLGGLVIAVAICFAYLMGSITGR